MAGKDPRIQKLGGRLWAKIAFVIAGYDTSQHRSVEAAVSAAIPERIDMRNRKQEEFNRMER